MPGMSEERRKSHVWHWVAASLVGLPALYVALFGPACWLAASMPSLRPTVAQAYWPLTKAVWSSRSDFALQALWRYGMLSSPSNFKTVAQILRESKPEGIGFVP
jgi:hypothetical protein